MKYINTKSNGVIIFSGLINHNEMSEFGEVIGAGFFWLKNGVDECGNNVLIAVTYGESVTLGIKPNLKDENDITKLLNDNLDLNEIDKIRESIS
jgi:hypothetical protein